MKRIIFDLPVKARASRTAIRVASVPEEVKRTRSAEGTSFRTHSAQAISVSWLAPKWVPRSICWLTASTTLGWEWPSSSAPWPPK